VHHRFAEPLELKVIQRRELVDQADEIVERHEGKRAVRRSIAPELDRAHLAAQVALADRLDLQVGREFHAVLSNARPSRLVQ
jgi:hypothetical protein